MSKCYGNTSGTSYFFWKASNIRKVLRSRTDHLCYFQLLYFLGLFWTHPRSEDVVNTFGKLGLVHWLPEQQSPLLKNNEQPDNHAEMQESQGSARYTVGVKILLCMCPALHILILQVYCSSHHTFTHLSTHYTIFKKHLIQHIGHTLTSSCTGQAKSNVYYGSIFLLRVGLDSILHIFALNYSWTD